MPILHQIAEFPFHTLNGNVDFPEQQISIEMRAGRDGVTLWKNGVWGKSFEMYSMTLVTNHRAALERLMAYKRATNDVPKVLTYGGYTIVGGRFQVLHVESFEAKAIANKSSPGDATAYRGILRCRWTLFPIADI